VANEQKPEKNRTPIHIRCFRSESWLNKIDSLNEEDLDSRFIFSWIAFNALYGQPKYLSHREGSEVKDIERFLSLVTSLDISGQIQTTLQTESMRGLVYDLTVDNYLNDGCWIGWYDRKLETVSLREKNAYPYKRRGSSLENLFLQIYVLRKQIFHGCSSNMGSKNREALVRSFAILEKLIPIFIKIVRSNSNDVRLKNLLDDLPYPPTKGGTG
jgi:hypothetical protein